MLKTSLGMGHGDANTLVHTVLKSGGQGAAQGLSADQVLDGLYAGPKAGGWSPLRATRWSVAGGSGNSGLQGGANHAIAGGQPMS
jgi:hypothetical protein